MSRTVITPERPMVPMTAADCGCTFVMARGLFTGNVIACGICDWCIAHPDLLRPARGPRPCDKPGCKDGLVAHGWDEMSGYLEGPCPRCNRHGQVYDIYDAPCWNCVNTNGHSVGAIPTQTTNGWENQPCEVCNGSRTVPARVDAEPKPIGIANTQGPEVWVEWRTKVTDIEQDEETRDD